jgi:uncharacterized lipoprotein NlpE involved in copper resistance
MKKFFTVGVLAVISLVLVGCQQQAGEPTTVRENSANTNTNPNAPRENNVIIPEFQVAGEDIAVPTEEVTEEVVFEPALVSPNIDQQ